MKNVEWLKLFSIAIGAAAVAAPQTTLGQDNGDEEELEFEEAQIYLELNDTDGDLGIHGLLDGEAWKSLKIEGPGGNELMAVWVRNNLRKQGLTEFFFESDEPSFDELTPSQFLSRFPPGTYEIEAITLDGLEMASEVRLSHVIAGPPDTVTVNGIPQAPNCDSEDLPEVNAPVVIDWSPVTKSHPTIGARKADVSVLLYQFVGEIEREGKEPETITFTVDLPHWVTRFTLPKEFTRLSLDGEVKYEIVTKLRNGNQTAVESCFELNR